MAAEKAGEAYVELGVRDKLDAGLKQAAEKLRKVGKNFAAIGAGISGVGAAALTPLVAMSNSFAEGAAEMNKLSTQTKISVEELSKLKFASSQVGVDFEDTAGAIEEFNIRLGETIQEGTGAAADAFKILGINAQKLDMMPIAEQIGFIGEALKALPRGQRQFLADEIFGGDAFKILPLLEQGRLGIRDLGKQAEEFGAVLSGSAAAGAAKYLEVITKLKIQFVSIKNTIGSSLIPSLTSVVEIFNGIAKPVREFIAANKEVFVTVAGLSAALIGGGAAISAFGFALFGIGEVLAAIGVGIALLTSPIGAAISAFVALGIAVAKYTEFGGAAVDWFIEKVTPIGKVFADTFARVQEALVTGDLNAAFDAVTDLMELSWLSLVDVMSSAWGGVMQWFFDSAKRMAKSIAGIFYELGGAITKALNIYGEVYNYVYNNWTEAFGMLSNVRTIGGKVDAFQGGKAIGMDGFGESVQDFAVLMNKGADDIGKATMADKAARDASRRQRLDALKKDISEGGAEARAAKAARRAAPPVLPDFDKGSGTLAKLPEVEIEKAAENMQHAARGTFSSFGAMFLGGQDSIQKDQLKVQQKIADNTETMAGGSLASVFVA